MDRRPYDLRDCVLAPEGIAAALVGLVSVSGVTALFGIGAHRVAA